MRRVIAPQLKDFFRVLRAYYLYIFCFQLVFGYAFYTFYLSAQGLSYTWIGLLLAFWSLTTVLFELPSGALSDRFDRKILLIFAPLLKASCFVIWILADGQLWLYAAGFAAWSAGVAFKSGTHEALLYEHVKAAKLSGSYEKLVSYQGAFEISGAALGAIIGAFLGDISMDMALGLSVIPLAVCSLSAFYLVDIRRVKEHYASIIPAQYVEAFHDAAHNFKTQPITKFLTLYMALGWIGFLEDFDQLFYAALQLPLWSFGLIFAAISGANAIASANTWRLKKYSWIGWVFPAISGLLLVLSYIAESKILVLALLLAHAFNMPIQLLAKAKFQKNISGRSRATITSILNLCMEGWTALLLAGMGFLAEYVSILHAYQVGGLYMIIFAAWAYWQSRKNPTRIIT